MTRLRPDGADCAGTFDEDAVGGRVDSVLGGTVYGVINAAGLHYLFWGIQELE